MTPPLVLPEMARAVLLACGWLGPVLGQDLRRLWPERQPTLERCLRQGLAQGWLSNRLVGVTLAQRPRRLGWCWWLSVQGWGLVTRVVADWELPPPTPAVHLPVGGWLAALALRRAVVQLITARGARAVALCWQDALQLELHYSCQEQPADGRLIWVAAPRYLGAPQPPLRLRADPQQRCLILQQADAPPQRWDLQVVLLPRAAPCPPTA
jgi:hypothetical protein